MKKMNNLEMSGPSITKKEISLVLDAMKNGWYGPNKFYYVEKFEHEFAKFHNRKYGLMTPNCTQALHLILHSLGIKKGDNVINQECTWVAPAAAVRYTGANNLFADINKNNWCLDEDSLKKYINKNTKAVIVSNIYGNMSNMHLIEKICKKNGLYLIEDAAEALGSKYFNKRAGSFGIASTFSFHRTKSITTGEGGMIVTNNKKLYDTCKFYRDQGRNKRKTYNIDELGFKYMPFNLQAALGYSQLKRIKEIVEKKRWIFFQYKKNFNKINYIQFNLENKNFFNGCWATTVVIGKEYNLKAKNIMSYLSKAKLPVRPFFYPLSSMKPFLNKRSKNLNKNAYDIFSRGLTLPSALNLNSSQIKNYSKTIIEILK
jgi:perosamine synthetase